MADVSNLAEQQAVAFREQSQQLKFAWRRTKSLAIAVVFGMACVALVLFGFWNFAICSLFISLIGVSNYFAANGHLHRLQKRGKHHKRLAREFSKLGPAGRGPRDPNPSNVPTPTG